MSYATARNQAIKDAYDAVIEDFADGYIRGQDTVVLLPGGMGSQLERSPRPYRADWSPPPLHQYQNVWIDDGLLFEGDARKLEVETATGERRDRGEYIVIPNGEVDWTLIRPYDGARAFFESTRYNFVVFGFDWRHSVTEAARWLHDFLKRLRTRIQKRRAEDPLPRTTLVCHSMGGLVAKVFLTRYFSKAESAATVGQWLHRVITVGTPFYGVWDQLDRMYIGQAPLNILYDAAELARVASSLPGPYILLPLHEQLYLDHQAYFLAQGLGSFPVQDADDPRRTADPFDPACFPRFPKWVQQSYLDEARGIRDVIHADLHADVMPRMFHIRGVKDAGTPAVLSWPAYDGKKYKPGIPPARPTAVSARGPGDGTVPAWSSRLVQTPDAQVFDLTDARVHGELLDHWEVLRLIDHIIRDSARPAPSYAPTRDNGVAPALPYPQFEQTLNQIAQGGCRSDDARVLDPLFRRSVVRELRLC
ncbi:MAG: hypothetical protein HY763_01470 [Planctomycetes bacterium]|nr:hypothetical protein [Planctomycetota bacterium]